MSSSMKNAASAAARPYRERAQPLERQKKFGLLEKHKDYTLRAKNFKQKQQQLKNLRRKAAEKNDDEFYHGMLSRRGPGSVLSKGKKGFTGHIDGDRGNKSMQINTVRLLKEQDMGYVRTMRNVAAKEVAALEERYVLSGGKDIDGLNAGHEDDKGMFEGAPRRKGNAKPRKIVFVEDVVELANMMVEMGEGGDDNENLDQDKVQDKALDKQAKCVEKARRRLLNARNKLTSLAGAEHELEIQRAKMAKTATSGGTTRRGERLKHMIRKR